MFRTLHNLSETQVDNKRYFHVTTQGKEEVAYVDQDHLLDVLELLLNQLNFSQIDTLNSSIVGLRLVQKNTELGGTWS